MWIPGWMEQCADCDLYPALRVVIFEPFFSKHPQTPKYRKEKKIVKVKTIKKVHRERKSKGCVECQGSTKVISLICITF